MIKNIDKKQLYDLYITNNLTRAEIATILKCKESTVKYILSLLNIKKPVDLHVKAIQKSCMKKYGLKNGGWTKESQEKIKKTNLKKFGVEFSLANKDVREKGNNTIRRKYGVDNVGQNENIKKKIRQSLHKNGSFKKSNEEDIVYKKLLTYFSKVERQYYSTEYPFKCDFYIPEKKLYIEYQGFWIHGTHPFNKDNEEDVLLLNKWKNINKPIYNAAIETWTIRDSNKRKIAKQNNLNWLEFFTLKEFDDWFKSLSPVSKF